MAFLKKKKNQGPGGGPYDNNGYQGNFGGNSGFYGGGSSGSSGGFSGGSGSSSGGGRNGFGGSDRGFGGNGFGGSAPGFGGPAPGFGGNQQGAARGYDPFQVNPVRLVRRFGLGFLIASLVGALLFFIIGEFLYRGLIQNNSVLGIGVYFGLFALILFVSLFVASRIRDLDIEGKRLLLALGSLFLIALLACLFEFLYELNPPLKPLPQTGYIVAMDNSGSMSSNDPSYKRVSAITQLVENKPDDFMLSVYSFGDEVKCIRPMEPVSAGIDDLTIEPSGGTPIYGVLQQIMDDINSKALPYEKGTQVILVTDGFATDIGFWSGFDMNSLLRQYYKKKISISTVGLGGASDMNLDEAFLQEIADKTGGRFVIADDVEQLPEMMSMAAKLIDRDRNLISYRSGTRLPFLYTVMRIVFVTILGVILLGTKAATLDDKADFKITLLTSLAGSLLGAILLEVWSQLLPFEPISRFLMVFLLGTTIVIFEIRQNQGGGMGTLTRLH